MGGLHFRFSLRFVLIALTMIAVLLGTWANAARRQRQAVAWVLNQGGHVNYDFEWPEPDGSYPRNSTPPGPKWLRDLIGIDYFARVTSVILDRDEIDNLAPLTNLSSLRAVALENAVHPRTDLSPLLSLKHLEVIQLDYTGIETSRLLPTIKAMPKCRIKSATDPELNR